MVCTGPGQAGDLTPTEGTVRLRRVPLQRIRGAQRGGAPRGCRDSSLPRVWGCPPISFFIPPRSKIRLRRSGGYRGLMTEMVGTAHPTVAGRAGTGACPYGVPGFHASGGLKEVRI
jgi:hypothetical protein